jgi:hypothetical protein
VRIEGAIMKTANPEEVRYCCSECGDEGFHLYYNIRKEVYHCFKCGLKGKQEPEKLYSDEKLDEIVKIMKGEINPGTSEKVLYLPEWRPAWYDTLSVQYMRKRGISEKKMKEMGCMVSDEPAFEYRIILPVYDIKGKVVYYQARALMNSMDPRYLNPIYPKQGALFYNMQRRPERQDHLFVVEGIFKALNLWRIEEPSVAILGKEITAAQIKRISELTDDITLVLDPDALGFSLKALDEIQLLLDETQKARAWYSEDLAIDNMPLRYMERWIKEKRCDTSRM